MSIAWVPLRSVATVQVSNVDKKTVEGDQPVRLCNYTDVYYNDTISADMSFMQATATQEQIRVFGLRKDDVVVTKDSETAEDIGIAAHVKSSDRNLVCGYHLAILRPNRRKINGRFLYWSLMTHHLREQFAVAATGVTRFGLRTESIAISRVPLCILEKQVAIAIFLDSATARIDALVEKKRQMINLLKARFWASITSMTLSANADHVPLRRALNSIVDGPFGSAFSSADYTLSGAAVVRLGNIGFAEYRFHNQVYIPMGLFEKFGRHRVHKGDLLIAGLGDDSNHAGRACVSPDLGDAIVKGKCFSARVNPSRASARYLAYILSTSTGAEAVGLSARGSTRSMINLDIIKSTMIPLPSVQVQRSIADHADIARRRADRIVNALERQIALLDEHRQALITAAVTGEMDVPGVSA